MTALSDIRAQAEKALLAWFDSPAGAGRPAAAQVATIWRGGKLAGAGAASADPHGFWQRAGALAQAVADGEQADDLAGRRLAAQIHLHFVASQLRPAAPPAALTAALDARLGVQSGAAATAPRVPPVPVAPSADAAPATAPARAPAATGSLASSLAASIAASVAASAAQATAPEAASAEASAAAAEAVPEATPAAAPAPGKVATSSPSSASSAESAAPAAAVVSLKPATAPPPAPAVPLREIGPIAVEPQRFNDFLQEADALVLRATMDLAEWRHELKPPTVRIKPSAFLRESVADLYYRSSDIGCEPLSQLSGALQAALEAMAHPMLPPAEAARFEQSPPPKSELDELTAIVECLRGLLHQFAAGIWPKTDAAYRKAMTACGNIAQRRGA